MDGNVLREIEDYKLRAAPSGCQIDVRPRILPFSRAGHHTLERAARSDRRVRLLGIADLA